MTRRHWLLPESPDLIALLRHQLAITSEALDAFVAWARGDAEAVAVLGDAQERADTAKRDLLAELRAALVVPLEPEDVFALSRGIDRILQDARGVVAEAEVLDTRPDEVIATMAESIRQAARSIDLAFTHLGEDGEQATSAADGAIDAERALERTYYRGMGALLSVEDRSERIASRELYRRCMRIGEVVIEVAERVIYAVVKES